MPVDDDDNFVAYGTALDPIEEEEVVRKKPITIQEQIATDENGRRRFHGAFTGGFSAGYYNTVGSKEGWTPSNFKSSRSDRFSSKGQNVTDFMDDEDMGAFGIAPQVLRPTDEFAASNEQGKASVVGARKRPKPAASDGPIPGIPVLHQIIEPVKETVGIKILIKMGWRPGQGVGPRTAKKKGDKKKKEKSTPEDEIEKPTIVEDMEVEEESPPKKSYGCEMPPELAQKIRKDVEDESEDEDLDVDVLYAPEDVDSPLCNPKENAFGLGYKGLERMTDPVGHVELFGKPLNFRVDKKKANITGEAFGIGAFEEPDEDVYNRDDMTQYDFELETVEERKKRKVKEALEKGKRSEKDKRCIEGFSLAKNPEMQRQFFPPPHLPHDFKPVHVGRKSRFDQPAASSETDSGASRRGLGRHALTIQERQVLIGEQSSISKSATLEVTAAGDGQQSQVTAEGSSTAEQKSATPSPSPSILERVERIKKFVQVLQAHSTTTEANVSQSKPGFKPFMKNPEKQDRYDKYLTLVSAGFQDCLKDLQPVEMTEWEREREKQEFDRAGAIYKPLSGVMQSRFVSAKSHDISHLVPEKEEVSQKDPTDDPKVAAKMNLFGKLTHSVVEWHPDKLLCKRFNVKDPFPDSKFVGLLGGTCSARKERTAVISNQTLQAEGVRGQTKKSLFENLDFSKPPPGLPSLNNTAGESGDAEPPPPGTVDDTQGKPPNTEETKSLEFQKNTDRREEKENVTPAPPKPPMDLFKEIFADSSSESEDEEPKEKDLRTEKSEERVKSHSSGKIMSDLRLGERDDRRRDRGPGERRRFDREDRPERRKSRDKDAPAKPEEKKRGIFDNLDLNQFRDRNTPSSAAKATTEKESEDEDEVYGPQAPIKPLVESSTRSSASKTSIPSLSNVPGKPTLLPSAVGRKTEEEEVVWVEKDVLKESKSSKSRKHSVKKSKKSKKAKVKSSKHKGKHKKSKKHKSKKSKVSKSRNAGHSEDSGSSSSDEDDKAGKKKDGDSSDDSSSSVTIHGSLDQKALLEQLKHITKTR